MAIPTERISRPAPAEVSTAPDVIEKGVLIARSTLAGVCLTAFACGIVATIAIGHGRAPAMARQTHVDEMPAVAQAPAPVPAIPAPAELAPAAAAPSDPLVVQMAGPPAAEPEPAADNPATAPQVVAARAPRPPVTRTSPARRRPAALPGVPATRADAPASTASAPAKWVDPFAE
ncbi:MAG: hypothetical protein ABUS79_20965 [Pseudomonadota bacterium]